MPKFLSFVNKSVVQIFLKIVFGINKCICSLTGSRYHIRLVTWMRCVFLRVEGHGSSKPRLASTVLMRHLRPSSIMDSEAVSV